LPDIKVHPGYELRVQTLGTFRVWRGVREIEPREWQRDKARQLFQLLLAQRGRWLQREEIVERLWPALSPEAAARDFKVALNALNKAIEPARAADASFAFIVREGSAYRLRPEADVWLDTLAFEQASETGLRLTESGSLDEGIRRLQDALNLYRGDYLPDALYEDWASGERERLLSLYLRAADRLAGLLVERDQFDEALKVCQSILDRDACWERAYRLMMSAHARQGNRTQAFRVYQRCVTTLHDELGVEPSSATASLFERIAQTGEVSVTGP
jgi:DNA-binding SARP family transcriptional activator